MIEETPGQFVDEYKKREKQIDQLVDLFEENSETLKDLDVLKIIHTGSVAKRQMKGPDDDTDIVIVYKRDSQDSFDPDELQENLEESLLEDNNDLPPISFYPPSFDGPDGAGVIHINLKADYDYIDEEEDDKVLWSSEIEKVV